METEKRKRKITDPIEARVELINGKFTIPETTTNAMNEVRTILSEAAKRLKTCVEKNPHDKGRLIHTFDLLQNAKDTCCVSLLLPFAEADQ